MATITGIRLEGFDSFIKAVEKMPDNMKASVMRGIIKKNMAPIALSIKNQAPVRSQFYTKKRKDKAGNVRAEYTPGNLRRSIDVRTFGRGTAVTGYAGIQKMGIADGYYGFFIERGTKYIPKNPFITRAASITVPIAADNLATDVRNYIVKNAQKLGLDAK